MSIEVTIGWWVLPTLVTIASFAWALLASASDRPHGDYDFSGPFFAIARLAAALILTLAAWLTWSLIG